MSAINEVQGAVQPVVAKNDDAVYGKRWMMAPYKK